MTPVCADPGQRSPLTFTGDPDLRAIGNAIKALELYSGQDVPAPSLTVGRHYEQTKDAIWKAFQESAVEGWDGYGAKAVDAGSCSKAIRFSQLLPIFVPVPDIYVDTDGELRFEWYKDPRHVFSVAVRSNGELNYAGLFGSAKAHGTEYFNDELPHMILTYIQRVYGGAIYCLSV